MEVSLSISIKELKAKYKKLVLKYHPDRNNCDSRQFLKIKEAYDILLKEIKTRNIPRPQTIVIDFGEFNNQYHTTAATTPYWSFTFG